MEQEADRSRHPPNLDRAPRKTLAAETLQFFLRMCKCGFSGSLDLELCIGGTQPRVHGVGAGTSRWVMSPARGAGGLIILWEKISEIFNAGIQFCNFHVYIKTAIIAWVY